MNKFWGHLKTITHHRHLVMRGCFRMGLIWQGLTHDLSKYSPTEFFAGVRYFQGGRARAQRLFSGLDAPQGAQPASF